MATPAEQIGQDRQPPVHEVKCPPEPYSDDMNDYQDLLCLEKEIASGNLSCDPFYQALGIVQDAIYSPYTEFDKKAVDSHSTYTKVAIFAVTTGALSVFCAVMEMIHWAEGGKVIAWVFELIFALLALFFIALGTMREYKANWILARYKAERLRLLKFDRLTDPSLWCDPKDLPASAELLRDEVRRISEEDWVGSEAWAEHGIRPKVRTPPCENRCQDSLKRLVHYYVPKRLDVQTSYLAGKSESVEHRGSKSARLVQWIFFASFAFVMVHLVVSFPNRDSESKPPNTASSATTSIQSDRGEVASQNVTAPELNWQQRAFHFAQGIKKDFTWEDLFAVLALFLPIVAGAIRTHRAAHEFERTAARHKATRDSLHWLRSELLQTKDPAKQFEIIGFCELVLEADCREFIRLVSETEWYG
jgi:hypothetical protein